MASSSQLLPNLPIDALLGRSPGGLGGKKLRFRPQLFWQEILPEHAATASLTFHCDMESGRNFARLPVGDTAAAASGGFARSVAVAVADGEVDAEEARLVARALREAATHEGPLMHLLSSCYCTRDALGPALLEAARHGNLENVQLLLHAGASAAAQPADENKTALHVACEAGHEEVAKVLVAADPECISCASRALGGRTALDVARDNDMGGLARRLEQYAKDRGPH